MSTFHITLRRGETHVEHYRVQERELQWRSRRSKRDIPNVFHSALRLCETPPSPPAPDPAGIENYEQLFSPLLAFTTRNEKSCLQFLIPTEVFHMLLTL